MRMYADIGTISYREAETGLAMVYDHSLSAPSFRFHHHSAYEFYIFLEGRVKICVENILYDAKPNSLIIFSPNMLHGLLNQDDRSHYERIYFHVPAQSLESMSTESYSILQTLRQLEAENRFYFTLGEADSRALFEIVREMRALADEKPGPLFELHRNLLLSRALLVMMDRVEQQKDAQPAVVYQSHPFLSTALRYINDHYTEKLSLPEIADRVNVSKYHLCHEFKRLTNHSMMTYITGKRLQHALSQLKKGVPPLDACFQSGFSSYSGFQKSFRACYGVSPRQYLNTLDQVPDEHPAAAGE